MSSRLSTADFLVAGRFFHADEDAALAAIRAVGAVPLRDLDLMVVYAGVPVRRRFGVVENALATPYQHPVLDLLGRALQDPMNNAVASEVTRRRLPYSPVSRRLVQEALMALHDAQVHLPWAFLPMAYDLAARVEAADRAHRLPFRVFYAQHIELFRGRDQGFGLARTGRVFSLPVEGARGGTWPETVYGALDVDAALLVEANILGPEPTWEADDIPTERGPPERENAPCDAGFTSFDLDLDLDDPP